MTGATEEENETLSGDYVITVSQSNVNYAMSSAAEGSRLAPIVITPENPFKTDDETLVWTINKSGDNYTISQGENYLSWQGGSTNGATTSTSPYELVITKNKNREYIPNRIGGRAKPYSGKKYNSSQWFRILRRYPDQGSHLDSGRSG